jgi:hypothetical protein
MHSWHSYDLCHRRVRTHGYGKQLESNGIVSWSNGIVSWSNGIVSSSGQTLSRAYSRHVIILLYVVFIDALVYRLFGTAVEMPGQKVQRSRPLCIHTRENLLIMIIECIYYTGRLH